MAERDEFDELGADELAAAFRADGMASSFASSGRSRKRKTGSRAARQKHLGGVVDRRSLRAKTAPDRELRTIRLRSDLLAQVESQTQGIYGAATAFWERAAELALAEIAAESGGDQ